MSLYENFLSEFFKKTNSSPICSGINMDSIVYPEDDTLFSSIAAMNGHKCVLEWLRSNGKVIDNRAMNLAAMNGRLDTVKYLFSLLNDDERSMGVDALVLAAQNGHTDVVKWLYKNSYKREFPNDDYMQLCMIVASCNGHLALMQWLHLSNITKCTQTNLEEAISKGHLGIVVWLYSIGITTYTDWSVKLALKNGHLNVIDWLRENTEWDGWNTLQHVSANSLLDIVKWIHQNPNDSNTVTAMTLAAKLGYTNFVNELYIFEIEKFVRINLTFAVVDGYTEVVDWLISNTDYCNGNELNEAASKGYVDIIKTLVNSGRTLDTSNVYKMAATNGHLDVIKFLHEHTEYPCNHEAFTAAKENGHMETANWLQQNRPECSAA